MKLEEQIYASHNCLKMNNETISLWITKDIGPRIIGLSIHNSDNLLAVLPDEKFIHPSGEVFHYYGGHRLWAAPEIPEITYYPDNQPVDCRQSKHSLHVTAPVESSGIQKSFDVIFSEKNSNSITISHHIHNRGDEALTLAPWVITQFPIGGTAILPINTKEDDPHGFLPNRQLTLWPYTKIDHPQAVWDGNYLFIQSPYNNSPFKVGFPNKRGWTAYWNKGYLFIKQAQYFEGKEYFDFQSSSECYCCPTFLELETLGPKTTLLPGESTTHDEIWFIYDKVSLENNAASINHWLFGHPEIELLSG